MDTFKRLSLLEKCNVLYDHGKFVLSSKISNKHFAIYVMDRKYNYCYVVLYIDKHLLTVDEIAILEKSDIADFIDEKLLHPLQRL